jgi:hypothetical protein
MRDTRNDSSNIGRKQGGGVYEKQGTGNRDEGTGNMDWRPLNMGLLCAREE